MSHPNDKKNDQMVPRSPGVEVPAHYTGAAGHIYHAQKRGVPAAAIPWIARLRAAKFQPWVKPGDTVFEYGVGSGWNLIALQCGRKLGCDLSEHVIEEVQAAGIEFISDSRALPAALADVIICHHTLEHLIDPAAALIEMRRLLRPSGTLLLHVPYEKERRYRAFDPAEPNHHLYSWNVQTLANLVLETKFTIIEAGLGRFGYDRFAARQAVRFHLGRPGFLVIRRLAHLFRPGLETRLAATQRQAGHAGPCWKNEDIAH